MANDQSLLKLFKFPSLWVKLIVYCAVTIIAKSGPTSDFASGLLLGNVMRPLVSPQVTSVLAKSSMTVALTVLIIFCLAALITYFSPWFWRQRKTRAIRRSVRENLASPHVRRWAERTNDAADPGCPET